MGCHNGVTAIGKFPGHFVTMLECNYCHDTAFFTPQIFVHRSPNYPGDHRRNPACSGCHLGNQESTVWRDPGYQPTCAGCHAGDYRAGKHGNGPITDFLDCAGACHINNKLRNPQHSVRDGGF